MRNRFRNKKWENLKKKNIEKNMMCDKNFFLKSVISFFFSNRIQNGFHQSEGLIFLDLMQF